MGENGGRLWTTSFTCGIVKKRAAHNRWPGKATDRSQSFGSNGFHVVGQHQPPQPPPACSSTPLELGTWPERRGSTAVAMRNARAKALKQASTTWWSLRP